MTDRPAPVPLPPPTREYVRRWLTANRHRVLTIRALEKAAAITSRQRTKDAKP